MEETTIVAALGQFIGQVGFPVFVAVYVLMRLEPTIHKLNETIRMQTAIIAKQSGIDYDQAVREYGIHDKKR